MADQEEPQFVSLSARIKALNQQQQAGKSPSANPSHSGRRPPPPPPPAARPPLPSRPQTTNNPPTAIDGAAVVQKPHNEPSFKNVLPPPPIDRDGPPVDYALLQPTRGVPPPIPSGHGRPPLPARKASPPGLPPREPSQQLVRRGSTDSDSTVTSWLSGLSMSQGGASSVTSASENPWDNEERRKLPPMLDMAALPPLPPTKRELEQKAKEAEQKAKEAKAASIEARVAKAPLVSTKSAPSVMRQQTQREPVPKLPVVPQRPMPKVPSRPASRANLKQQQIEPPELPRPRILAPIPKRNIPTRNILEMGFSQPKTEVPILPPRNKSPPPIPLNSKPSMAVLKAVQYHRPTAVRSGCLKCRDFSGPDAVAAEYPRQNLPRTHDITAYLAEALCAPFGSPTDKARAIFTWLHYNIAYDTLAFFGNNVKHVDPKDTVATGLAVCGGYAGLYVAIAQKAGLECVMVTGHGKGYGYAPMQPGEPVSPRNPTGHAWNAVRIDNGVWKLVDSCWGAGNVSDVYNQKFVPSWFTMSNEDFGIKHFPADDRYFLRADGRVPTWKDYIIGPIGAEPLQLYGSLDDHGLSPTSFLPAAKAIDVSSHPAKVIRIQFSKVCTHWDFEKNGQGKPYCLVLKINNGDGEDMVPLETDGYWYWLDIRARDLGREGQEVSVMAVMSVDGRDARGLTKRGYEGKRGRCGMGFGGICAWDLV